MFPRLMVPTAVLSDVHGNLPALDAVLDHARRHGATRVITLGDIAYGPLDPRGAVERLMGLDLPAIHIRGNEDRILWESREPVDVHRSLVYTRSALTERHLRSRRRVPGRADDRLCLPAPDQHRRSLPKRGSLPRPASLRAHRGHRAGAAQPGMNPGSSRPAFAH